jgi:hypothetical protein
VRHHRYADDDDEIRALNVKAAQNFLKVAGHVPPP